jgi:hypothetical protein
LMQAGLVNYPFRLWTWSAQRSVDGKIRHCISSNTGIGSGMLR